MPFFIPAIKGSLHHRTCAANLSGSRTEHHAFAQGRFCPKLRQFDESQLLIEILIRVVRETPARLLVLLAEPPATPVCSVPVDESVGRCARAKIEVIGSPSKFLIQKLHHLPGIQPFHVSPSHVCVRIKLYFRTRFAKDGNIHMHAHISRVTAMTTPSMTLSNVIGVPPIKTGKARRPTAKSARKWHPSSNRGRLPDEV